MKPAEYTIRVTHATRVMPFDVECTLLVGDNKRSVELPVSIVEGKITDEDGEPMAGVTVRAVEQEAGSAFGNRVMIATFDSHDGETIISGSLGGVQPVKTDEYGNYELRGVVAGKQLYVEARAKDYEPQTSESFELAPGEQLTFTFQIGGLPSAPCPEDLSGNGIVDFEDILEVLAHWGEDGSTGGDTNDDNSVDFEDILGILAAWGPCP